MSFTDRNGTQGIAPDGKPPANAGVQVTILNPTGPNTTGTWDGWQINPNK